MRKIKSLVIQTAMDKMDTSNLPLIRRCMDNASKCEAAGDTEKANEWLELSIKAEAYYATKGYKTLEERYKE